MIPKPGEPWSKFLPTDKLALGNGQFPDENITEQNTHLSPRTT